MDYFIGFLLGFLFNKIYNFIKKLAEDERFNNNLKTIIELDEDWDWIDGR